MTDAPVRVLVRRPDHVEQVLTLAPDPTSSYRAEFADTGLVGAYLFSTEVSATTPLGTRVTRHRNMTGIIYREGHDGGGGHGGGGGGHGGGGGGGHDGGLDEASCKEAHELLRRLAEIIERCCRGSKEQETPRSYEKMLAEIADRQAELQRLFRGK